MATKKKTLTSAKPKSRDEDGMPYKPQYKTVNGTQFVKVPSGDWHEVGPKMRSSRSTTGGAGPSRGSGGNMGGRGNIGGGLRKHGK
tara:strand:+ start:400 stop:657 length:258 start_codon:yes stop_codon:yes gene_type:complete